MSSVTYRQSAFVRVTPRRPDQQVKFHMKALDTRWYLNRVWWKYRRHQGAGRQGVGPIGCWPRPIYFPTSNFTNRVGQNELDLCMIEMTGNIHLTHLCIYTVILSNPECEPPVFQFHDIFAINYVNIHDNRSTPTPIGLAAVTTHKILNKLTNNLTFYNPRYNLCMLGIHPLSWFPRNSAFHCPWHSRSVLDLTIYGLRKIHKKVHTNSFSIFLPTLSNSSI